MSGFPERIEDEFTGWRGISRERVRQLRRARDGKCMTAGCEGVPRADRETRLCPKCMAKNSRRVLERMRRNAAPRLAEGIGPFSKTGRPPMFSKTVREEAIARGEWDPEFEESIAHLTADQKWRLRRKKLGLCLTHGCSEPVTRKAGYCETCWKKRVANYLPGGKWYHARPPRPQKELPPPEAPLEVPDTIPDVLLSQGDTDGTA